MKYLLGSLLIFVLYTCVGQKPNILLKQELVTDISEIPQYERMVETVNGELKWKDSFSFLDSIEISKITYLSDGLKVKGYLVKPSKQGKYPCIIYNRGGNRNMGKLNLGHIAITFGKMAKEGYVVIASQYRGNGGGEGKEEFGGADVNDVTILPEVLKEISSADTDRIGMYGWSRGGLMTYSALTKSDQIKAAVVGGAVSDSYATISDRPSMETGVLAELVPNYEANKNLELDKRSPIKWVDKFPKDVPILMLHGNADWRVKPEQSLNMALEFEKYRIPYRLIMFEGGDHGITEHRKEVQEEVLRWFDRYLKNNEAIPNMEYHGQ